MVICPSCHTANPPKASFCRKCGQSTASTHDQEEATVSFDTPPRDSEPIPVETALPESAPIQEHLTPFTKAPATNFPTTSLSRDQTANVSISPAAELENDKTEISSNFLEAELLLSIDFHRVLVAGYTSTFIFRLENPSPTAWADLEILLDSTALGSPIQQRCSRLVPGQSRDYLVEVETIKAGNFILTCEIQLQADGQQKAFRGTRSFRINKEPGQNIQISIGDIQCNRGEGSNVGLGAEGGDISINNLISPGTIRNLNDLLNLELPEQFVPVPLDLDYTLSIGARQAFKRQRKVDAIIPRNFIGFAQCGQTLRLTPLSPNSPISPLLLVAGSQFRIGRARPEVDYIAWFLPRNSENDQRTMRISKLHAVLEIDQQSLVLRDNETSNKTSFDGMDLSHGKEIVLDRRGILTLSGSYRIDIHPFTTEAPDPPAISNLRLWSRPGDALPAKRIGGSVSFHPADQTEMVSQAVWILSEAAAAIPSSGNSRPRRNSRALCPSRRLLLD